MTILVADGAGQGKESVKLQKAREKGVQVWDEEMWMKSIAHHL